MAFFKANFERTGMKRVFVLNKTWFDKHRSEIGKLESSLMSLQLVDAQATSDELMTTALKESSGIRLADFELEFLIESALKYEPQLASLLFQCHIDHPKVTTFQNTLNHVAQN